MVSVEFFSGRHSQTPLARDLLTGAQHPSQASETCGAGTILPEIFFWI
jgi:hypothetical protein